MDIYGSALYFVDIWYWFFFQVPFLPEIAFSVQDYKVIGRLLGGKAGGMVSGTFTKEDTEAYKYAFSRPGAKTCAIDYYRAFLRNIYQFDQPNVTSPVLLIWGMKDVAMDKEMAIESRVCVDRLTVEYIEEASHWVQGDTPGQVHKLMREFLRET